MAQSYSGAGTKVLVAGTNAAGTGVAYDLAGLVTGGSITAGAQLDAGYYIGNAVQEQPYIGYMPEMGIASLRRSAASIEMARWVEAEANPEGWLAFILGNGAGSDITADNLAFFSSRRFASSSFTSDFTTIVGHDITTEPGASGTLYQGDALEVSQEQAGAIAGTPATAGGAGVRALFICTAFAGTGASLPVGGRSLDVDAPGAYFTTADLDAGAVGAITTTGTFTRLEGWLLVGRGIV